MGRGSGRGVGVAYVKHGIDRAVVTPKEVYSAPIFVAHKPKSAASDP